MHIHIVAVGKIKEKYLQKGIQEFTTRLRPYARIKIREIKEERIPDNARTPEIESALHREAVKIKKYIDPSSFCIVLAIEGRQFSSPQLADYIRELTVQGYNRLTFIIGGPHGLDSQFKGEADLLLSFSRLTFTHQLMRLILIEQLYRVFKILRGEPYHY